MWRELGVPGAFSAVVDLLPPMATYGETSLQDGHERWEARRHLDVRALWAALNQPTRDTLTANVAELGSFLRAARAGFVYAAPDRCR